MTMKKQSTGIIMQEDILGKAAAGYKKLAAAIIRSGERENDQAFLNSEWCESLRYFLKLGNTRGSGDLSGTPSYTNYV